MSESNKQAPNSQLFGWQETRTGLVFIVLFDLLVTYGFASWAIDSGSLLAYAVALVFLLLAGAQAVKLIKKVAHRG